MTAHEELTLNGGQQRGMEILNGKDNVFLTGQAGVGKTTLVKEYLKTVNVRRFPVVASTGMAALLAGGRTAHSAFGLGTMSGTPEQIIRKALENPKVTGRLQYWKGFLIDEISMIDARTFGVMEHIARGARHSQKPWGGLRVIAVGDFAQLPPVSNTRLKPWCFKSAVWQRSNFHHVMLSEVMRTQHHDFIEVLNYVRRGVVNDQVEQFLDGRILKDDTGFDGTRLFGKKADVENYNIQQLRKIDEPEFVYETVYEGQEYAVKQIKKRVPIGDSITLKKGALVMLRTNDPDERYVNGSLGWVQHLDRWGQIEIRLMKPTRPDAEFVWIDQFTYEMKDGDDRIIASARNYPLSLAYAMTIHKTQGATLDKILINASDFWEAGQCYVALSRVKTPDGLFIRAWEPSSIMADPEVLNFYETFKEGACNPGNSSSAQLSLISTQE